MDNHIEEMLLDSLEQKWRVFRDFAGYDRLRGWFEPVGSRSTLSFDAARRVSKKNVYF
jgi:hypothetical protein